MKYIDAEKLKAEIERMREINRKALEAGHIESGVFHGRAQTLNYLFEFIDSLQQEQPEVDLEKEIERVVENYNSFAKGSRVMKPSGVEKIARHFYELGLKARKV